VQGSRKHTIIKCFWKACVLHCTLMAVIWPCGSVLSSVTGSQVPARRCLCRQTRKGSLVHCLACHQVTLFAHKLKPPIFCFGGTEFELRALCLQDKSCRQHLKFNERIWGRKWAGWRDQMKENEGICKLF
jgi:hypothetical protein